MAKKYIVTTPCRLKTPDGSKITGELVGKDTYADLAVVKVSSDKSKTVAEFANSNSLTVGRKSNSYW